MIRKILFLASNPTDTGRLRLDKEINQISEGLKRSNEREQFELIPTFALRAEALRRALLDYSPRIVHFAGHAGVEGIVVEDDKGEASQIPKDALSDLFELCAKEVECVILNACYTDIQAEAIARHIPYVIGMTAAVSDDAAVEFAVGFYDALGAGRSIEDAYRFGCNAIALKAIPENMTPILKKRNLTEAERQQLERSYSPVGDVFLDVSVVTEDTDSWGRGEDTILRYSIDRNEDRIRIESNLAYLAAFRKGGPIEPLNYLSPTWCAFKWDFPILDFKVLNNRQVPLFLTEVVLEVAESRVDPTPLFTIKRDTQQRNARELLLINEGACDLNDLVISFHLLPGQIAVPTDFERPFRHSLTLALLEDSAQVDVTPAFQEAGVDIQGLILLGKGRWEEKAYVASKADGSEERLTEEEVEDRWKRCLGPFSDEVGTLVGEIKFTTAIDTGRRHSVKFYAPVYLVNQNRMGISKPPTYRYDTTFETQRSVYERRVQVSQELQPGETDRFTIKVAVAKSSFHKFRATLIDITGLALESLPIELSCFVPRSREQAVKSMISPQPKR